MSTIYTCSKCGGNIVYPSWEGDGAWPVEPMCKCSENQPNPKDNPKSNDR